MVAGREIQIRVWATRAAFFLLAAAAVALMLLSKAETALVESAQLAIVDAFAPVLEALSRPVQSLGEALLRRTGVSYPSRWPIV